MPKVNSTTGEAEWSLVTQGVPASGLTHIVGANLPLFYSIAVNTLSTGPPASPCLLVVDGVVGSAIQLPYGQVTSGQVAGKYYTITGVGNNVTVVFGSTPTTVQVTDITVTATIPGTVKTQPPDPLPTDIGQAGTYAKDSSLGTISGQLPVGLDTDGFFKIRYLGGSDVPGRGWTLGSGDIPARGWNLGSLDVPGRGWTLGSGDVPSRGWNLGSSDVPGRGWNLSSSDVPGRGWTLGGGDTPSRSWTLGGTDTPSRSWTLGTSDAPDITKNQSAGLGSASFPVYIRDLGDTDLPGRSWTLGGTDTPSRSWSLGSSDAPDITKNQSAGLGSSTLPVYIRTLGSSDAPDITKNQSAGLGSSSLPVYIRTLGPTDTPTAYGSAGKALQQDSLGNQYHVPVLQGTSTPVNTKAMTYDSNGYPQHTIANTLPGGGGGDSVVQGGYFYNGTGASGNSGTHVYTAQAGFRVLIDMMSVIVVNNSTTDSSSKVSFTALSVDDILYPISTAGGSYYPFNIPISDTAAYYVGTTTNSALVDTFYTQPQSLAPNISGLVSVAYSKVTYAANNGPASGDTTVVNSHLVLLPGDVLQVNLTWSGGTTNTNFLAYFYIHGHTEVL